jgi:hypothetical protein
MPEKILESHRDDIVLYYDDLIDVFSDSCQNINGIFLQKGTLYHCVESLFLDIYRLRTFHGIESPCSKLQGI